MEKNNHPHPRESGQVVESLIKTAPDASIRNRQFEPEALIPDSPGHDHPSEEPRLRDLPLRIGNIPRFLLLAPIRLYQATFSRALPPDTCRFYPSCSHYGYQAIYKHGALKGGWLAFWRVLRCNPFNPGGFDPVP